MAAILVIDDHSNVRAIVTRILGRAGHRVTEAASGKEALASLQRTSFDVVICDLYMDDGDGMEFLVRLRAEHAAPPKVIIVSGGGSIPGVETIFEIAQRLGAVATLQKPFTDRELLQVVQTALIPEP